MTPTKPVGLQRETVPPNVARKWVERATTSSTATLSGERGTVPPSRVRTIIENELKQDCLQSETVPPSEVRKWVERATTFSTATPSGKRETVPPSKVRPNWLIKKQEIITKRKELETVTVPGGTLPSHTSQARELLPFRMLGGVPRNGGEGDSTARDSVISNPGLEGPDDALGIGLVK